jgi:predicted phosphoribosyltransferase
VVVAIPRGGVVTGAVLARALRLPLDVILTKKIGHPLEPEYAIGVVNLAHEVLNQEVIERDKIKPEYIRGEIARIRDLLRRRQADYYGGRQPIPLMGKTALIVDDGVATGNTMLAAIRLARDEGAKKVVIGVPVAPGDTLARLREQADEVFCVLVPQSFFAIGQFYDSFEQVGDAEAIRLLHEAASPGAAR